MLARLLLALVLLFPVAGLAQSITPEDCHFFDEVAAGSDRLSTVTFGNPFDVRTSRTLSVQVSWMSLTGSVNATVQIQVSNDPADSSRWIDKTGAVFTLSGANGSQSISVTTITEGYARVKYVHGTVSGGTLDGRCAAKG